MKKLHIIGVVITMLLAGINASGQTPHPSYQFPANDSIFSPGGSTTQSIEYKMQSLYSSRDFPGVPNGWLNALYFRIGNPYQLGSNTCALKYFTVKIGYTYDSVFKGTAINPALDSFRSGLTTIYGPDTFS
ncbi:MAG: hypothetical protein JST27_01160, partial [Bacteroidetes bacterium]|nr:hypothetical protein [Bacteroidota bacterium]